MSNKSNKSNRSFRRKDVRFLLLTAVTISSADMEEERLKPMLHPATRGQI